MFAREHTTMIDLKEKPATAAPMEAKAEISRYPTLYIDKDLGLTDKDLNKKMTAKVEIRLKRYSKTITNGETKHSCELEIMGIAL